MLSDNIIKLQEEKKLLQEKLGDPGILKDPQKLKELSIEFSRIEKELSGEVRLDNIRKLIRENEEILNSGDEELKNLAEEEISKLKKEEKELLYKKSGEAENMPENIIMEIRAGAGGEEAAIFAKNLYLMYSRFAEKNGWETVMLGESISGEAGGYKEVVFEINGKEVFRKLCFESGVHRVQRIPETEKNGRIHTSTASVAVLAQAREVDVEIKPTDIKIEFFRSSGPGGQNVNKVETAVRIYHLPTGLVVASQDSRSQQKNREKAMTLLRTKLLDAKLQKEAEKMSAERKKQIGTADRSEKIRTYNFPQDRITDHRIKESWHNIESIMAGNLDAIIKAFENPENKEEI